MISNKPKPKPKRYEVHNRYLFEGRLVMQTALHIGGGKFTLSHSDSPVVLTPEGKPFIPGSSFKGALRSTVEKLIPNLPGKAGLFTCGLPLKDDPKSHCPTPRQSLLTQMKRQWQQQGLTREEIEDLMAEEFKKLCHTCQLFGSPFAAAHINMNDL